MTPTLRIIRKKIPDLKPEIISDDKDKYNMPLLLSYHLFKARFVSYKEREAKH